LFAVAEGNEVRLDVSREWMEGTTGGRHEEIKSGPLEEGADESDAASPLKLERGECREDDATKDRLASGREEERGNGIVLCGRVAAYPVVESGVRNALLLGILPLGRRIGVREVVEGGGDVRPWPAGRVWAEWFRGSKLIGGHGSFSLGGLLAELL